MAITYTPKISLQDFDTRTVGISILRSDDSATPATEATYVILSTLAKTAADKLQVVSDFKLLIEEQDSRQTVIDTEVSGLEVQLKNALDTWEATR